MIIHSKGTVCPFYGALETVGIYAFKFCKYTHGACYASTL